MPRVGYNSVMKTKTKYSPFDKMLEGLADCLTGESAERVLAHRADAKLQKYLDQLADKCTEGALTPEERSEYEACVKLGTLLAMLKSKLRQQAKSTGE